MIEGQSTKPLMNNNSKKMIFLKEIESKETQETAWTTAITSNKSYNNPNKIGCVQLIKELISKTYN